MSGVTEFVSELVRAANGLDKLSEFSRAKLLDRAYDTIRDLRDEVGIQPDSLDKDAAIDVLTMSRSIPALTDAEVRNIMLKAAAMIRDLHIILDTGTQIHISGGTPH